LTEDENGVSFLIVQDLWKPKSLQQAARCVPRLSLGNRILSRSSAFFCSRREGCSETPFHRTQNWIIVVLTDCLFQEVRVADAEPNKASEQAFDLKPAGLISRRLSDQVA
jgi:hypothetical protein